MNSANSNCPDTLTIQSILNDTCDPAARTEVESHIDECEDCQRRLSEFAESGWRDLMPEDGRLSIKEAGTGDRPCSDETRHVPSLATSSIDLDGAETTVIQNYEVVSEIARGGMGVVYRAIDRTLGRDVANAICSLGSRLDLNLRCGLDTGPCDIGPNLVTGPAVEQAYRIASTASLQSVVVSESVYHLVSGAGLEFVPGSMSPESDVSEVRVFQLVR
jgi:hypothetical protein